MTDAATLFDAARARLVDAPRERIGELQEGRRLLGIRRAPRIVPRGTAWHLGVLLVTDDEVLATGDIVRARAEVRRGFAAESQRRRAELAAAAARGGVPEGETVHIGWHPVDPSRLEAASRPLAVREERRSCGGASRAAGCRWRGTSTSASSCCGIRPSAREIPRAQRPARIVGGAPVSTAVTPPVRGNDAGLS